jgi:hypothetical protein
MLPAASSGSTVFQVQTYDATPNLTFTVTCTATAGDSEITMAYNYLNAFNFYFIANGAYYGTSNTGGGIPVFSDQNPQPTFYADRTDHVVSFWSQARYSITQISDTTGSKFNMGPNGTLVTYAQAQDYAPMLGTIFEDLYENSLAQQQILDLLAICSDQIIKLVNNNFVVSNYLHEHVGCLNGSIILRTGPILDYDTPLVRRPYVVLITAVPLGQTKISYQVDRKTKLFNYRFTNDLIDLTEPLEMNNDFKLTYRAGYQNIPTIVKEKIINVANLVLTDTNLSALGGGSAKFTFRLPIETLKAIAVELRNYRNDPE